MARLEVAVRSPICFRKVIRDRPLGETLLEPAETVGIEFEGRLFVWHTFNEDGVRPGDERYGPTVSVVVADDEDGRNAGDDVQRFPRAFDGKGVCGGPKKGLDG